MVHILGTALPTLPLGLSTGGTILLLALQPHHVQTHIIRVYALWRPSKTVTSLLHPVRDSSWYALSVEAQGRESKLNK